MNIIEIESYEDTHDNNSNHKPTDDEIGDMLMQKWNGNKRYFFGQWHEFIGGVWQPFTTLERAIWEMLKNLKSQGIRPTANKVSGIEKYLQSYLWVDDTEIDSHPDYINVQNGLFNIVTGELEPHKRELFSTSQLPFAYDPDADCPHFRKFLFTTMCDHSGNHDVGLRQLVEEALGYSLTSNTDHRVSFWLQGESSTGKSVLINTLHELAGNSHTTIDLDQMSNNPYQIADIAGKRVVTFTEPRANSVLADNHYKRLVSQDAIMARQIFGKPFRFVPICKVWGAMNDLPRVIDRSDAIFNRVIIIPMNYVVPPEKRDRRLTQKLRNELAGIFNLALTGLKRLRRRGHFELPDISANARTEYKSENDIEAAFFEECCIADDDSMIAGQQLYDAYSSWCRRNGAMAKSSVKVARDWKRLGLERKRSNGTWYRGVRLNEKTAKFIE